MPGHLFRCELPLRQPLATGVGTITTRTSWVVAVEAGGARGLGEAAPLPGFGGESIERCEQALVQALELLTVPLVARFLTAGDPAQSLDPALEDALRGAPCARFAIEGALMDLAANLHGVPLCDWLTLGCGRVVAVNALVDGSNDGAWAVAAGYRTLKLKAVGSPGESAELVAAMRDRVGPDVRLRLDVNGRWDVEDCARFVERVPMDALEYIEQPLAAGDVAGAAALRPHLGIPMALDESVRTAADVGRIGALQAADVVILKPMFLGGWRPLVQAVALARAYDLGVVVTSALDGAIGRAHGTHQVAALGLAERAHGLATGERLAADLMSEPLTADEGLIRLRDRPGLGLGELLA